MTTLMVKSKNVCCWTPFDIAVAGSMQELYSTNYIPHVLTRHERGGKNPPLMVTAKNTMRQYAVWCSNLKDAITFPSAFYICKTRH